MSFSKLLWRVIPLSIALSVGASTSVLAQKKYDVGATDSEIKIGNIMPYSGPLSAYGVIGETEAAYMKMINDQGGINGRKVNFISYDDAYSPPKTVEQARKLVESDEVLLIFHALGTPTNSAIHKYMNVKKVPQLFVSSGATKWNDPKHFPWTTGWQPNYQSEARIFARFILKEKPDAKIAVFFQNDDSGVDFRKGFRDGLGEKANSMIVAEESYETSEPTIDSHIVKMRSANADVLVNFATPKFAAQAIKKMAEIGWKPMHVMTSVSISVASVMKPAGIENGQGIISATYLKDPTDPQWKDDPGIRRFDEFLAKYYPKGNRNDVLVLTGYSAAQSLVYVLKACGDDLTRKNVMKQAGSLKDVELDGLLPGIKMNTSANDFGPIQDLQLIRFKGQSWERFGEIISGRQTPIESN
ncbi:MULTISPECIES: ABC transporter substrate-binding protein [Rhodopseudomonas]|uniref:Branched-chain amino acid ABC transporter substrate-binding protein n=1 Tax=Rhodopseudomonas palustris TaxID=1076 RepID=A0A0D7EI71_RHOPL|nr:MULTISPECIES: ABC transporter substrate-binding protein [Rhodopseudomonas]KIZ40473.1 branched-chain amino acid ABC transporter substrate-binding protein [Rhodopseudomonas palustris]MDF3810996.1 ABC transporter substrate-binding protein [Rhodopseudomonas sp. BAL398]WOK15895.1 ABC transporter substrate-binding protein [Rhodopseudomonas sp. BAL398]